MRIRLFIAVIIVLFYTIQTNAQTRHELRGKIHVQLLETDTSKYGLGIWFAGQNITHKEDGLFVVGLVHKNKNKKNSWREYMIGFFAPQGKIAEPFINIRSTSKWFKHIRAYGNIQLFRKRIEEYFYFDISAAGKWMNVGIESENKARFGSKKYEMGIGPRVTGNLQIGNYAAISFVTAYQIKFPEKSHLIRNYIIITLPP